MFKLVYKRDSLFYFLIKRTLNNFICDNGKNTTFQGKSQLRNTTTTFRFAFFDCQEEKTCPDQEPAAILEFMESNCKAP